MLEESPNHPQRATKMVRRTLTSSPGAHFNSLKVTKDEGLTFSILRCLSLQEARRLWSVQRLWYQVLDGKVIPILALQERDWRVVRLYLDSAEATADSHPRFEYNFDSICVEAILHSDFDGLQLLAERNYNFTSVQKNPQLVAFARRALQKGTIEHFFLLRAVSFNIQEVLEEVVARGDLCERLSVDRSIMVDFLGTGLSYRCNELDFATTDFVERQLADLCRSVESLYKVPFVLAAFISSGASPACLLRPESCGYLLLLALASESFNFVYLLVKEGIYVRAVLEKYREEVLRMVLRALKYRRYPVLELLHFCGFSLQATEELQRDFDELVLQSLLAEDFAPIERICSLGFSFARFAERNQEEFQVFVQRRLEDTRFAAPSETPATSSQSRAADSEDARASREPSFPRQQLPSFDEKLDSEEESSTTAATRGLEAGRHSQVPPSTGPHPAIKKLVRIDRRALEFHFRSEVFLDFVAELLAKKSFVALREIVEVHSRALEAYFRANYRALEGLLVDAFLLRDISFIVDVASLNFPMEPFFARHQVQIDSILLQSWWSTKCWTELLTLKNEVRRWSAPAFFERTQSQGDELVVGIIKNGYWYDLHNLAQMSFDFPAFFDRCFHVVGSAVLNFITMPRPHFVLLRELSALNFPWGRFMQAYRHRIEPSKDHDFLQFVMSLEGFDDSKVYEVVEHTCRLYHSMAASMFKASSLCQSLESESSEPQQDATGSSSTGERGRAEGPAGMDRTSQAEGDPQSGDLVLLEAEDSGELLGSLEALDQSMGTSSGSRGKATQPRAASAARDGDTGLAAAPGHPSERGEPSAASATGAALGTGPISGGSSGSTSGPLQAASPMVGSNTFLPPPGGFVEGMFLPTAQPWKVAPRRERRMDAEAAKAIRIRAKELARRAGEKKLEVKKVLMLLVCKGAYCWNPLQVNLWEPDNDPAKEPVAWAEIESVLGFYDSREDSLNTQAGVMYNQLMTLPHMHAAPGGGVPGAAAMATMMGVLGGAVAVHPLLMPGAFLAGAPGGVGVGLHPALPEAAGPAQQLIFHLVCLAQRGEERMFMSKVELFWDAILENVLTAGRGAAAPDAPAT